MEQRGHRPRRPVRAELHARRPDGTVDIGEGRQDQRAVPGVAPVLVAPGRAAGAARAADRTSSTRSPHMTFVTGADERRLPAEPRRGAARPSRCSPTWSTPRTPRRIARVGAAARSTSRDPGREDRRDPHRWPAPTSTSAPLTQLLFARPPATRGVRCTPNHQVTWLKRENDGTLDGRASATPASGRAAARSRARFVFVGAGGGALPLLQKLRHPRDPRASAASRSAASSSTTNPRDRRPAPGEGLRQGRRRRPADVGAAPRHPRRRRRAPPAVRPVRRLHAEVPEVAARWFDLPLSVRLAQPRSRCSASARKNFDLVKYLVGRGARSRAPEARAAARVHAHGAKTRDWELITAGQRVQVIKKDPEKGGVLQFGTEVITGGRRHHRRPARRLAGCVDGRADHARRCSSAASPTASTPGAR